MIYKFRMILGDRVAFLRDYELVAESTFLDFHNFIQCNLNFSNHQLASFFLADEHWNKGLELTLLDMQNDSGLAAVPMETVTLADMLKSKRERLLYVFDIFSDRSFFIELVSIVAPQVKVKYPICTASEGEAPEQITLDADKLVYTLDDEDNFSHELNDFDNDEEQGFDSESYTGNEEEDY